jgi:hypothetical protein
MVYLQSMILEMVVVLKSNSHSRTRVVWTGKRLSVVAKVLKLYIPGERVQSHKALSPVLCR